MTMQGLHTDLDADVLANDAYAGVTAFVWGVGDSSIATVLDDVKSTRPTLSMLCCINVCSWTLRRDRWSPPRRRVFVSDEGSGLVHEPPACAQPERSGRASCSGRPGTYLEMLVKTLLRFIDNGWLSASYFRAGLGCIPNG